jgi:hypothetical protein
VDDILVRPDRTDHLAAFQTAKDCPDQGGKGQADLSGKYATDQHCSSDNEGFVKERFC